jgi:hypothetical protein
MGATEAERLIMGFIEVHTPYGWQKLEDVPLFDAIPCQLCNEPTMIHDLTFTVVEGGKIVPQTTWMCKKCNTVNG